MKVLAFNAVDYIKDKKMKTSEVLARYQPIIYSVLRVVTGFLFLWHGSSKLFSFPPAGGTMPAYIHYIAGIVEFAGGLLVMTGLFTRWAAFFCSGEMAVAYWGFHFPNAILPLVNHGELAMLYCFVFLFILFYGAGKFSIDQYIFKGKEKNEK
jgi:putative oxidoreductase